MSIESTRDTMLRYFNSEHGDISMMAKDVVFTIMATGQEHQGPEAVLGMLNYFYHVAFEATANTRVTLFGENNAMIEGDFVGKHIGEFAGIPATGKDVNVPHVWSMIWRMIKSHAAGSILKCLPSYSNLA